MISQILFTDGSARWFCSPDFRWGCSHLLLDWVGTSTVTHSQVSVLAGMVRRLGSSGMSGQLGPSLQVVSGPFPLGVACPCGLSHGLSSMVARLRTRQLSILHV